MNFYIDDIVEQNHFSTHLLRVSGVIHDEEKLFVTDDSGRYSGGKEFEICFCEVTAQYRSVSRGRSALKMKVTCLNCGREHYIEDVTPGGCTVCAPVSVEEAEEVNTALAPPEYKPTDKDHPSTGQEVNNG